MWRRAGRAGGDSARDGAAATPGTDDRAICAHQHPGRPVASVDRRAARAGEALDEALTRLGYGTSPYTDSSLTPAATVVQAVHLAELRARVQAAMARLASTPPISGGGGGSSGGSGGAGSGSGSSGGTTGGGTSSILMADQLLSSLTSADGRFQFVYQGDGNIVLYQGTTALWSSQTYGSSVGAAVMQGDGNFVLYDISGTAIWNTDTEGHAGAYLVMQNDGNVVVYAPDGTPLWSTGTGGAGTQVGGGTTTNGGCTFAVSPLNVQIPGSGVVTISTEAGCSWTAFTTVPWITATPTSGVGSGAVSYTIDVLSTSDVSPFGTIVVAGRTFTIRRPANIMQRLGITIDTSVIDQCQEFVCDAPDPDGLFACSYYGRCNPESMCAIGAGIWIPRPDLCYQPPTGSLPSQAPEYLAPTDRFGPGAGITLTWRLNAPSTGSTLSWQITGDDGFSANCSGAGCVLGSVSNPLPHWDYQNKRTFMMAVTRSGGEFGSSSTTLLANAMATWDCFDERSDLNQEYLSPLYNGQSVYSAPNASMPTAGPSQFLPGCGLNAYVRTNDEFRSEDAKYGDSHIVRQDYLHSFMEEMRARYVPPPGVSSTTLIVSNGYRNPAKSSHLSAGRHPGERHQYGDAVDVVPDASVLIPDPSDPSGQKKIIPRAVWDAMLAAAQAAGGSWLEKYSDAPDHVHVDLRWW